MVALSYRGFWSSNGRASQAGIEQDAVAALDRRNACVLRRVRIPNLCFGEVLVQVLLLPQSHV